MAGLGRHCLPIRPSRELLTSPLTPLAFNSPPFVPSPNPTPDAHALDPSEPMEKPSRRRRPLLPPLPLRLHRLTRFILSHPRPVRLRLGERRRQIRRSAPMGSSISKHKRGRSRATPRRTCQTLISSSKVEAAPMSDRCEIRSDADPIQGASGGPGQVAQVSNLEATHRGSSSRPPLGLLKFPGNDSLFEHLFLWFA